MARASPCRCFSTVSPASRHGRYIDPRMFIPVKRALTNMGLTKKHKTLSIHCLLQPFKGVFIGFKESVPFRNYWNLFLKVLGMSNVLAWATGEKDKELLRRAVSNNLEPNYWSAVSNGASGTERSLRSRFDSSVPHTLSKSPPSCGIVLLHWRALCFYRT